MNPNSLIHINEKVNPRNTTVVICCAGMGTRLGIGTTKALIDICGKPLIFRQLEQLDEYDDIRIVVGFQAEKLITVVNRRRVDIMYVFNYDYQTTGVAASLRKALLGAREYILAIDGDVLVNPKDFSHFLHSGNECIAVSEVTSTEPIMAEVEGNYVISFSTNKGNYSWPGLLKIRRDRLVGNYDNVYDMLAPSLPLDVFVLRAREINTPEDYEIAIEWFSNGCKERTGGVMKKDFVIGILGGMGTYATIHLFQKYAEIFKAEKEWDRPRIIIDNRCTMPSRVRAFLYNEKTNELIEEMTESMLCLLRAGATRLILACNTSHLFLPQIYERIPTLKDKVVDIIQNCVNVIASEGEEEVFLIGTEGTLDSGIYQMRLKEKGITCIVPQQDEYFALRVCIEAVKQNTYSDYVKNAFLDFVNRCSACILGCTELPILYERYTDDVICKNVYDPLLLTIFKLRGEYEDE